MIKEQKISFIGSGAMAEAMIQGLLAQQKIKPAHILAIGPRPPRGDQLKNKYHIVTDTDNNKALSFGNILILATKPQSFAHVASELKGCIQSDTLVISIQAGISLTALRNQLGHERVVRSMPNTPGKIGEGITVFAAAEIVSEKDKMRVKHILETLGEVVEVDNEDYLDMATALSGTGPAYVFLLMEAMIEAGVHMGFPRHLATQLVSKTVSGAAKYAHQSGANLVELRNNVTSPGGTTAQALYHFEKGNFRTVVTNAIFSAFTRSMALGRGEKLPRLDY